MAVKWPIFGLRHFHFGEILKHWFPKRVFQLIRVIIGLLAFFFRQKKRTNESGKYK